MHLRGTSFSGENSIDNTSACLLTGVAVVGFVLLSMVAFNKFDRDAQSATRPSAVPSPTGTVDLGGSVEPE